MKRGERSSALREVLNQDAPASRAMALCIARVAVAAAPAPHPAAATADGAQSHAPHPPAADQKGKPTPHLHLSGVPWQRFGLHPAQAFMLKIFWACTLSLFWIIHLYDERSINDSG